MTIFGFPIGLEPTNQDLELAFEGESLRSYWVASSVREQRICDSKGISWLGDLALGSVLWLDISLGAVRHRKADEVDPTNFFGGKLRIGQYTVQGPFSFEIGEVVRKVVVPSLEIRLIPDATRVRAVTIAFLENERRLRERLTKAEW